MTSHLNFEGGKGMSVYDIRQPAEFASDWKVATDSYHRYREARSTPPPSACWRRNYPIRNLPVVCSSSCASVYDYDIRQPAEFASDWKVATDSYHRYREDFDLMQDLGMVHQ
jgi:hypothetical protein